jgi:hypothetical protein
MQKRDNEKAQNKAVGMNEEDGSQREPFLSSGKSNNCRSYQSDPPTPAEYIDEKAMPDGVPLREVYGRQLLRCGPLFVFEDSTPTPSRHPRETNERALLLEP